MAARVSAAIGLACAGLGFAVGIQVGGQSAEAPTEMPYNPASPASVRVSDLASASPGTRPAVTRSPIPLGDSKTADPRTAVEPGSILPALNGLTFEEDPGLYGCFEALQRIGTAPVVVDAASLVDSPAVNPDGVDLSPAELAELEVQTLELRRAVAESAFEAQRSLYTTIIERVKSNDFLTVQPGTPTTEITEREQRDWIARNGEWPEGKGIIALSGVPLSSDVMRVVVHRLGESPYLENDAAARRNRRELNAAIRDYIRRAQQSR